MAKDYLKKLSQLISDLTIETELPVKLETKHFFSGAALYSNGVICASWSPAGLAFKLSESEVANLIASGEARPLKYFENGHIKKSYATFINPDQKKNAVWRKYFLAAIEQAAYKPSRR